MGGWWKQRNTTHMAQRGATTATSLLYAHDSMCMVDNPVDLSVDRIHCGRSAVYSIRYSNTLHTYGVYGTNMLRLWNVTSILYVRDNKCAVDNLDFLVDHPLRVGTHNGCHQLNTLLSRRPVVNSWWISGTHVTKRTSQHLPQQQVQFRCYE